jgi:hypothetical protein
MSNHSSTTSALTCTSILISQIYSFSLPMRYSFTTGATDLLTTRHLKQVGCTPGYFVELTVYRDSGGEVPPTHALGTFISLSRTSILQYYSLAETALTMIQTGAELHRNQTGDRVRSPGTPKK